MFRGSEIITENEMRTSRRVWERIARWAGEVVHAKMGRRWCQDAAKMGQDGATMVPRWAKMVPREAKMMPREVRGSPKGGQREAQGNTNSNGNSKSIYTT